MKVTAQPVSFLTTQLAVFIYVSLCAVVGIYSLDSTRVHANSWQCLERRVINLMYMLCLGSRTWKTTRPPSSSRTWPGVNFSLWVYFLEASSLHLSGVGQKSTPLAAGIANGQPMKPRLDSTALPRLLPSLRIPRWPVPWDRLRIPQGLGHTRTMWRTCQACGIRNSASDSRWKSLCCRRRLDLNKFPYPSPRAVRLTVVWHKRRLQLRREL